MEKNVWESEKVVYIKKLERIINGVSKILALKGNTVITSEMKKQLIEYQHQADSLLPKLKKDEFEIAVVGLEKAGKSSFSNAFIGLIALPTDDQRCTYTSTCIRKGETDSSATVCFYTREEFDNDFKDKLHVLGIPNATSYDLNNLSIERYTQLFDECDESKKMLYENTLNQDIIDTLNNKDNLKQYIGTEKRTFSSDQLDQDDFKRFITNPACAIAVKDVVIYSTELKEMPNAIMYDVPGFNSPTKMHQEQTLKKMQSADAIIMVAKADEPSITGDVLQTFKNPDVDGGSLKDKLFIFANKADRATDLEKNKKITYNEWINKWRIISDDEEGRERFVFGSANAHLGEKAPNGIEARKNMQKKGIKNDGIDILRQKLKDYYETKRFEVLKKRIDKIIYEIQNFFNSNNPGEVSITNPYDNIEYPRLILSTYNNLQDTLKTQLEDLKNQINIKMNTEHPLSKEISDCIKDEITCEHYTIEKTEVDTIHKQIAGISSAEQPQKLDAEIREKRFVQMYHNFSEEILKCTSSEHKLVSQNILELFSDAMHLNHDNQNYENLLKKVNQFCGLEKSIGNDYYQSIIERFARDLFEVQIKFVCGTDRLNKFREEAANFLSLGVFFNASTYASIEDNHLSYINNTPEDSPMWRIILYPELATMTSMSTIIDKLKALTGIKKINTSIIDLLSKIQIIEGNMAIEILEKTFSSFVKNSSEAVIMSNIMQLLEGIINAKEDTSYLSLKDILTGDKYLQDIAIKHQNYSYEYVQKEFDEDISALQIILQNAFIPAVNIDKAFSARETKMIEDIINSLESNKFQDFIAENLHLIESSKVDELKRRDSERQYNTIILNEIKSILDSIGTAKDNL